MEPSLRQTCPECGRTSRPNATECRKCGHAFATKPPLPTSSEVVAVLERESRERTERRLSRRSKLGLQDGEVPAAPLAAIDTAERASVDDPGALLQVVAAERKARRASIRQVRQELVEEAAPDDAPAVDKAAARRQARREEAEAHDRAEAAKVGAHIERAADDLLDFLTPKGPAKRLEDALGATVPNGPCLRCKRDKNWPECTAFEAGPVRKGQCVTCLHAATDHEQDPDDGGAKEKQRKADEAKRKAAELESRRKVEEAEASQQRKERRAAEAEAKRRQEAVEDEARKRKEEAEASEAAKRREKQEQAEAERKQRRAQELAEEQAAEASRKEALRKQRDDDDKAAAAAAAKQRKEEAAKQRDAEAAEAAARKRKEEAEASEAAKRREKQEQAEAERKQRRAQELAEEQAAEASRKEVLRKQRDDDDKAAAAAAKQRKEEAAKQRDAEAAEAASRRRADDDEAAAGAHNRKVVAAAAAAGDAGSEGGDGNVAYNKSAKTAIQAAQDNEPTFTALQLTNNTVYAMKHRDYSEQLGRALQGNTHLREVTLVKCDLDHFDATFIAAALRTNTTLRVLNLAQNKITNEGATAIADALRDNRALMELNLLGQGHAFGEPCLQSFIDMFGYNVTLTKIIWRLDSRKSFAINKLVVRNNTIKKWALEGKDLHAMYPAAANVPIAEIAAVLRRNGATVSDDDPEAESGAADTDEPRAAASPRGAASVSPRAASFAAPPSANAAVKKLYDALAALEERWRRIDASGAKAVAGADAEAVCSELAKLRPRLEELSAKHSAEMASAVAKWRAMNKDIPARINDARSQANKAAVSKGGGGACAKCSAALSGSTLEFGGRSYHAKCFVCKQCAAALSTTKAIAIGGFGFCEDCGRVAFSKAKFVEMALK